MLKIKPSSVKGGLSAIPAKPGGVTSGAPMMPPNGMAPYKRGGGVKDADDQVPKTSGEPKMKKAASVKDSTKTSAADALKESRKPNKNQKSDAVYQGGKELPALKKGGSVSGFGKMPKMQTTM